MWNPYAPIAPKTQRIAGISGVLVVLIVWSVLAGFSLVAKAKLPAPWDVVTAFLRLAWDPERGESLLLEATLWSTMRVLVAGVLVVILGVPIGVLMGASPVVNAALLPILVMWLGIAEGMKIAFLFIGAVVFLIPMVRDAIQAVPSTYWISATDLGATPWEAVRHSVLPIAMPRIADAVVVAVSVMWTYITVAEYVNPERGLGQLIQNARRFSAMDQVFVGIFVIIALALVTYRLMIGLKRWMYPWENEI
jgi:ABC-type nitrate/sulfonate/bicarbonate transport system permease component